MPAQWYSRSIGLMTQEHQPIRGRAESINLITRLRLFVLMILSEFKPRFANPFLFFKTDKHFIQVSKPHLQTFYIISSIFVIILFISYVYLIGSTWIELNDIFENISPGWSRRRRDKRGGPSKWTVFGSTRWSIFWPYDRSRLNLTFQFFGRSNFIFWTVHNNSFGPCSLIPRTFHFDQRPLMLNLIYD